MRTSHLSKFSALLALLLLGQQGLAQEAIVGPPYDGTEAFGYILKLKNLNPTTEDAALLEPKKSLIIIFGDLSSLRGKLGKKELTKFCSDGGALLIATDFPDGGRLPFGLSCSGDLVESLPQCGYREIEQCPKIEAWLDPLHPLCKGLTKRLATNRPSFLTSKRSNLKCLAEFNPSCDHLRKKDWPQGAGYIFAGAAPQGGRVVILAGQGVFLNSMLIQQDNDNFQFALNTIGWLAEGPKGARQYALFINQGQAVNSFTLPLSQMPVPPIQVINRLIRGVEDENLLNRILLENVGRERILRGLLLIASALLLFHVARQIRKTRWRLDTRVPLLVSAQEVATSAPSLLEQKHEELRQQGNLWEPAQVLARQFFLDHGGKNVPLWENEVAAMPPVQAQGNLWQRRSLKRLAANLWGLARSSPAQRVSPKQFDKLMQELQSASAALREGRLRFIR
jgi:hypothetical protein